MKKLFRTVGSFAYSSVISAAFLLLAVFALAKVVVSVHGFWMTSAFTIAIVVAFAWLSEIGLQWLSLPFNLLWDETPVERIAAAVPPVLAGLWCISAPFRIEQTFTAGDWVFTVVWGIGVLFFYVNLFLLPFLSKDMGIRGRE